ncbi:hypothetical protein IAT40_002636 [Kwoniella sp. CBS 6097]
MPIRQLTPEIWSHIFLYCVEEGDEGAFAAQETLYNGMRVNSTLFMAAGPHLYRSPKVEDIGSFLLGADKSSPSTKLTTETSQSEQASATTTGDPTSTSTGPRPRHTPAVTPAGAQSAILQDLETFRAGNTKLPLLRHTLNLTILPYPRYNSEDELDPAKHTEEEVAKVKKRIARPTLENIIHQDASVEDAHAILHALKEDTVITPNLQCLTIGSCIFSDDVDSNIQYDSFVKVIVPVRNALLRALRPKYWCEYGIEGNFDVKAWDCLDTSASLPKQISLHLDIMQEKLFPIMIGTKNILTVRGFGDAVPDNDPRSKDFNHPRNFNHTLDAPTHARVLAALYGIDENGDEDEGAPAVIAADGSVDPFFEGGGNWDEPQGIQKREAAEYIMRSLFKSYPPWMQIRCKLKDEVDKKTVIEIYGLEKVLRGWHHADHDLEEEDEVFDETDGDEDEDDVQIVPGAGPRPPTETDDEFTERKQRLALSKVEALVKTEIEQRFNNYHWSKKRHPTVKLFLAKETPRCEACGQGERGVWEWNPLPEQYRREDYDEFMKTFVRG